LKHSANEFGVTPKCCLMSDGMERNFLREN
jgi:hypothetical protein